MHPYRSIRILLALALTFSAIAAAQAQSKDILIGVTYTCNGERMFAESCNIRDTSDTSTCMVGHPDHIMPNGLMKYTTETRGTLKKLFPTCTQPSAKQVAAAETFQKRQQDLYNANVAKANQQMAAATAQPTAYGQPAPPKNAEERAIRRCVSSGRLPSTCTGNSLLGAFGQMLSQVLPGADKEPPPGPNMAGVFQGPGSWRLDFIDNGVLVNCSYLSPNQEAYTVDFKNGRPTIVINTTPRPLVLTLRADNTIVGPPGPVTLDGVIASGSSGGGSTPGHTETHDVTTTERINAYQAPAYSASQLTNTGGGTYDATTTTTQSTYVPGTYSAPQTHFSPRRVTCPAINLSTKGASVGIQTMQTDLLKSMFGGDKGPPTPPGIRMHGIFAAISTGFSVEFHPESAVLGCGPDSARAYPYTVEAEGPRAVIKIAAPDHPLSLAFLPNGALEPAATGPYQVHGRIVTGQDDNDNFTFAPLEQTCNLATLTPSKIIPTSGGSATPASGTAAAPYNNNGGSISVPGTTLGNALLTVSSGFPTQPGTPNPLAVHPYTLLRSSFANIVARAGVTVPSGMSPYKVFGAACATRTPDCPKILAAIRADAASAVRADANGTGTLPAVAPGAYYLMISTRYNNQGLVWDQPVQLISGPNSITLDLHNATPIN